MGMMPPEDRLEEIGTNLSNHVGLFLGAVLDCYRSDPVVQGAQNQPLIAPPDLHNLAA